MRATVRCWPKGGGVLPAAEMEFATAPLVGDYIEVIEYVTLVVRSRRFSPEGGLVVWCDPEPGSDYTFEMLRDAFDEVRGRNG